MPILLENGDTLLLENGDEVWLEEDAAPGASSPGFPWLAYYTTVVCAA